MLSTRLKSASPMLILLAAGCGGSSLNLGDNGDAPAPASEKAASNAAVAVGLARKIGLNFADSGSSSKILVECPDGGTADSNQDSRTVNSPFSSAAFDVTDLVFEQCAFSDSNIAVSLNGPLAVGAPPQSDGIGYSEFGSVASSSPVTVVLDGSQNGQALDGQIAIGGVLHTLTDARNGSFDIRQTTAYSATLNTGQTVAVDVSTSLGDSNAPFILAGQLVDNILQFSINGSFAYQSDQLPEACQTGAANFSTLDPIVVSGTDITAGRLSISTDGVQATIQFNSDGSSDVLVDGENVPFTAQQLAQLDSSCAPGSELLAASLQFTAGYLQ